MTEAVRAGEVCSSAVDVLVNNAGYGYRVAVEEGDEADVAALFATNFFGAELAELADWEATSLSSDLQSS